MSSKPYEKLDTKSVEMNDKHEQKDPESLQKSAAAPTTENEEVPAVKEQPASVPWTVWMILLISCFGVFMASVSTSALVIAFPILLSDLNMSLETMIWVLLVLLLVMGAVVPSAGKAGDIFGQTVIYKFGYVCFVAGSLGAGFVQEQNKGYDLIACRVVIGFGAALVFTNSQAILTNAFAPYNKVGLAQGTFGLVSALGIVFGPLIGGAFSNSQWRWIFWYNVPPGGIFAIMAIMLISDEHNVRKQPKRPKTNSVSAGSNNNMNSISNNNVTLTDEETFWNKIKGFDFVGAFFCMAGLTLILLAMVQAVAPNKVLKQTGSIVALVISGCFCGTVFIIDQFYHPDPLIPPEIFKDPNYCITTINGAIMMFVRNSIIYDMIFFFQGPYGQTPLNAGIYLIPFGLGIMFTGFFSGLVADKIGIRTMTAVGPIVTLAGVCALVTMNQNSNKAAIEVVLLVAGLGIGLFQSPNIMANLLSVDSDKRGVAAAVSMLTMTFSMMVGIVLTFSLILNYLTLNQLYQLFIFGGTQTSSDITHKCLFALSIDFYILLAFCIAASLLALLLPSNLSEILKAKHVRHVQQQQQQKESQQKEDQLAKTDAQQPQLDGSYDTHEGSDDVQVSASRQHSPSSKKALPGSNSEIEMV